MRKNRTLLIITAIFILLSIFLIINQLKTINELPFSVQIVMDGEVETVNLWECEEGTYYVFLPTYAVSANLYIQMNTEIPVYCNGQLLYDDMLCDMFSEGETYELHFRRMGKNVTKQVIFLYSRNIATMYIETQSGSMDYIHSKKGNKESGDMRLYSADGILDYKGVLYSIGGRGNASWTIPEKKPYSLRFQKAVDLLQMGAAEKWILLANEADPTNLKNKLIYDFADDFGLAFSPNSQWVDLYLNSEYVGLYLLTERNEIHPERVAISEDGWLVSTEFEDRLIQQNYPYFSTQGGLHLRIHEPDQVSVQQQENMKSHWQSIENAIIEESGVDPITGKAWTELIDLDSWARRYLIEEIFANGDALAISQFYYTPDPSGTTYAGPVWDEDYSMSPRGEWRLSYPNLLAARLNEQRSMWYYKLYQKEEYYNYVLKIYENEARKMIRHLIDESAWEYAEIIRTASIMNQIRWNVSYGIDEELTRNLEYLSERIDFLDQLWIKGTEMVSIQIDSIYGVYRGNILIPVGTCVGHDLVPARESGSLLFKGWYFADTGEPFDKARVIYEDVEVIAKWEDSPAKKMGRAVKLFPLFIIAVLGIHLLEKDICFNKKKR